MPKKIYFANLSDPESQTIEDMTPNNTIRVYKFKRDIILFEVNDNHLTALIKAVGGKHSRIDVLVNNAEVVLVNPLLRSPGKISNVPSISTW